MADLSASFSEEEHRKFQRFWDLAEGDDVDIEEKFDLFDQYFKTPAEARAYDEWCKFYKEEEMKLFGAPTATPSGSQPESTGPAGPEPEPAPLHVYQERLARVDFSRPHEVAGLNELLNCGFHPHIPVGHIQGRERVAFRLVPNTSWLSPTKEMNWKHDADKVVIPPMVLGINHTVILNKPKRYGDEELEAICRYLDDSDYHSSDDEEEPDFRANPWEEYGRLCKKVESFSTPGCKYGKYGRYSNYSSPEDLGQTAHAAGYASSDDLVENYTSGPTWEGLVLPSTEVFPAARTQDRRRRRAQARTDESTASGNSTTTNDQTGFAFYQLGALHYCNTLDDPTIADHDSIFSHDWHKTGYILVVQIEWSGKLGAVWILWDFWADRDEGEPTWCPPVVNFPGTEEYVTGAKIAGSFAELGSAYEIRIPDAAGLRFTEDFELVGCFRLLNENNRIVRQWVVDPSAAE